MSTLTDLAMAAFDDLFPFGRRRTKPLTDFLAGQEMYVYVMAQRWGSLLDSVRTVQVVAGMGLEPLQIEGHYARCYSSLAAEVTNLGLAIAEREDQARGYRGRSWHARAVSHQRRQMASLQALRTVIRDLPQTIKTAERAGKREHMLELVDSLEEAVGRFATA